MGVERGAMLDELVSAAAAAGGSAVVQAAGTDLWNGFRGRVAEWFGRGDAVRESRELERLDRSASELSTAGQDEVERLRVRHEAVWQSRIETLLEDLDGVERDQAVAELSKLMAQARP
ncbi:putative secreted protein [Streptomyces avermitilis MA-4680 = NBRC 14893]|uniref:Secreted protein n=2 Tax=Streptomyces avermitilis TaxID=33903 RepID=Q82R73_STRAW|nr:putative secreted protein [Streptomyces avermitilis MA-4680 = NBRC 14893]